MTRADLNSGRASQKERTRDALVDAARSLLNEGEPLSIVRAAEVARVSQATAYRYYPDPQSLMRDALKPRWAKFEALLIELSQISTVGERARRAGAAMAEIILSNEAQARAWLALSYQPRREDWPGQPRPQRAALVDAVMEVAQPNADPAMLRRVALALSATIGSETVLALKDSGAPHDEIIHTAGWIAQQVVVPLSEMTEDEV